MHLYSSFYISFSLIFLGELSIVSSHLPPLILGCIFWGLVDCALHTGT